MNSSNSRSNLSYDSRPDLGRAESCHSGSSSPARMIRTSYFRKLPTIIGDLVTMSTIVMSAVSTCGCDLSIGTNMYSSCVVR